MDKLVWGLVDQEIKGSILSEVNQIGNLRALIKLIEVKEYEKCYVCKPVNTNPIAKPDKKPHCKKCGRNGYLRKRCQSKGTKKKQLARTF